jgi:hypothetical protein
VCRDRRESDQVKGAGHGSYLMPFSREGLSPSSPWGVNSGHAPRNRCASLFRQRHLSPADQTDIGDGMVWGATRPGGDLGGRTAGHARDAVETRGLEGLLPRHRRQDGGQVARQPRCARSRGAQE